VRTAKHCGFLRDWGSLVLLALVLVVLWPHGASAHAVLIRTDPPRDAVLEVPPAQVTLVFTEPVEAVDGGYRLFDATGLVAHLDVTAPSLNATASGFEILLEMPANLPDGSYLIDWRVTSNDTHPISGALVFSIGAPSAPPASAPEAADLAPVMGAVQGIGYVTLLAATGLLLFDLTVSSGGMRNRRLIVGAAVIAVAAHLLLVPMAGIRSAELGLDEILRTEAWRVGLSGPMVSVVLLIALGLVLAVAAAFLHGVRREAGIILGVLTALVALPLVGHTETVEPSWLMWASDLIHAFAGAIWFGGLIGLAQYLHRYGRSHPAAGARVVERFSVIAGISFAVAAASGSVMAFRIVDGLDALTGTTYGQLLIAKLLVLAVPFALAAWNRLVLVRDRACPGNVSGVATAAQVRGGGGGDAPPGGCPDRAPHAAESGGGRHRR
jgi:copper transport protein